MSSIIKMKKYEYGEKIEKKIYNLIRDIIKKKKYKKEEVLEAYRKRFVAQQTYFNIIYKKQCEKQRERFYNRWKWQNL